MDIYLPVEVVEREITARAMLAAKLASLGHNVFVFEHTFFDRYGWPGEGLYIGKNFFRTEVPYEKKFYRKMKAAGIQVWYLDEEGGVFAGTDENDWKNTLKYRINPGDLDRLDKILSWGQWQKQAYEENGAKCDVHVSGSPNFTIYQKKYHHVFNEYDLDITNGLENFILINTRFGHANNYNKNFINTIFSKNSPDSKLRKVEEVRDIYTNDNKMFACFIEMITYLSKKLTNEVIVVRPHPAECAETYKTIFSDLKNVFVRSDGGAESWIRLAKVMIHNGCTTGIQAAIAGKNVISYQPLQEETRKFYPDLPNKMGVTAQNPDEIMDIFTNIGDSKNRKNPLAEIERTISSKDSIDYISELIMTISDFDKKNNYSPIRLRHIRLKHFAKNKAKKIINKNKAADLSDFKKIINLSATIYSERLSVEEIGEKSCFLVKKSTAVDAKF